MLQVNEPVICINDDFSNLKEPGDFYLPKFGLTYTVREVTALGITLNQIINKNFIFIKHGNLLTEPMFNEARFVSLKQNEEVEAFLFSNHKQST
jgi:hypothetical protein